jgi:hypothetical protein
MVSTNLFLNPSHAGQRARLEKELERLAPLANLAQPMT